MAYNANGMRRGHGDSSQPPTPPVQYGITNNSQSNLNQEMRRISSFDTGDDARFGDDNYGSTAQAPVRTSAGYRYGSSTDVQNEEMFIEGSTPPLPVRTPSYASNWGGYQLQSVPTSPSTQPAYNPQRYANQNSSLPFNSTGTSTGISHQPYVPAAYHPSFSRQSHLGTSVYGSSPTQSPPLPSRPSQEHPYAGQRFSQYGGPPPQSPGAQYQGPSRQPALPPPPGLVPLSSQHTVYNPPAPPPPPLTASLDEYSNNNWSPVSGAIPSLPDYQTHGQPRMSPRYSVRRSTSPRPSSYGSLPPTPGPPPPQHSPHRSNTVGRHPQSRPLPGPPSSSDVEIDYFGNSNGDRRMHAEEGLGFEDLMREIETAVVDRSSSSSARRRSPREYQPQIDEEEEPQPLSAQTRVTSDSNYMQANGVAHSTSRSPYVSCGANTNSDESDAEAAAGLAAMQMAEDEEARGLSGVGPAFGARGSSQHSRGSDHTGPTGRSGSDDNTGEGSDSDIQVDMGLYSGGYIGQMRYGGEISSQSSSQANISRQGSMQYSGRPNETSESRAELYNYPMPDEEDFIHPFPTLGARVDTGGTGGLQNPTPSSRRLSFDDGDEATLVDSEAGQTSGSQSPARDSLNRPLPRLPHLLPSGSYAYPSRGQQYDTMGRPMYPGSPGAYEQLLTPSGTPVPRSSSLVNHSSTPQTVPPIRSQTDAEKRRLKLSRQQQMADTRTPSMYGSVIDDTSSIPLDLPEIPMGKRKKYNPAKLSTSDFKRCSEPWAMSAIVAWIKDMTEDESYLRENIIVDGIVALFTHKVPTMNTADAETLGTRVVKNMFESGTLVKEEEWVKFGPEPMTGVLFQLTGTGCYAPRVHSQSEGTLGGRCYAHHCMRTLKKINLQTQVLEPARKVEDWATFYKIKVEDIADMNKKEIERQNNLHEIITTEDNFMDQLNVLRVLYRDELARWQPPIITPGRINSFLADVFGKVDAIKKVNEDYLLAQLKYRQQEQGPWIIGFSDIFREWIRKAKTAYIEYAASFPNATFLVRKEAERNILFQQFLNQMRENERSKRLDWNTYLKAPITRLQRYSLLLTTVHKNTIQDSDEKRNLQAAIDEVKAVTLECDSRVADMSKKVDLSELASKLKLRPGMKDVELNLTHLGREIIFQGDLQRTGANRFTWLETRAILFDHYFVLAKTTTQRDAAGGLKYEQYDVSKLPIPMDLLVLESTHDEPVIKSSVMKGMTVTTKDKTPQESWITRTQSSQSGTGTGGPGTLIHANTGSSLASVTSTVSGKTLVASTVIDSTPDARIFPFKIKHLGKSEIYTLYAPSAQNRQDWCDKITEAKTRHAASLFAQNAEPFRLRVLADTAFAYDAISGGPKSIVIHGTPLDRAIREVENSFDPTTPRPGPVCRAVVNCATTFNQPYPGSRIVAIGTDYGVYISDYSNPRGWIRAIATNRVTQIAVLEEFSLFLLIADKSLIAYQLDTVVSSIGANPVATSEGNSSRRAPQKLSGARDVGFFVTGRMKDRTLVFYKKRRANDSLFKVLEPVYQKSATIPTRGFSSRLINFKKGTTEFFRDFDDFYIPAETYALNVFHSSLAISTARGVEVLTLDKKVPFSVPDLRPPDCVSIASRVRDQKPLGMFRLNETEFLIVFEEVGVYVDKRGDVSRGVVMEFVGKARQAVLYGGMYLVLVDTGGGFVEVRNADNGRLRQVVSGRDVRLLDDGGEKGTIKICMQHPEWERCQIVVEMVVNEGLKE